MYCIQGILRLIVSVTFQVNHFHFFRFFFLLDLILFRLLLFFLFVAEFKQPQETAADIHNNHHNNNGRHNSHNGHCFLHFGIQKSLVILVLFRLVFFLFFLFLVINTSGLLFDTLHQAVHLLIVQHLIGVSIEGVELTDGQQR